MLGALPGAVDSVSTDLRGGGWEVMGGPGPPHLCRQQWGREGIRTAFGPPS